ncbi:MAG: nucleoside deaminase [Candidatus Ancaeobacter aquaticus]|nr:nucleoside deaminase [Candidatus Ancaeobacter aquaticus]
MNETSRDEKYMALAIEIALAGIEKGQSPFGACIVKGDTVISCEHNVVWDQTDITAHAEIHAIQVACKELNSVTLDGCTIYSTCEPCPMCFSAIHWARISKIVFGASIADAKEFGFNELEIENTEMKKIGNSGVEIVSGVLREKNITVFQKWHSEENRKVY